MRFIVRPTAIYEAVEARSWVAETSEQAEHDFSVALNGAFALVQSYPRAGTRLPGGYRRILVHGYPYGVVYLVRVNEVIVVALAHTSRKPGYWRGRR